MFTLPACRHTIGPLVERGQSVGAHAPLSVDRHALDAPACRGRGWRAPSARSTCTSSPTTTRSGGAPKRPFASTSQPWRARSAWRAAPSPLRLAVVAQVTKPTPVLGGQAEHVDEPGDRRVLERGGHRRGDAQARRSGPTPREPARGRGRGQRPADDEAEEPRSRRGEGGGRTHVIEQSQHLIGGQTLLRQWRGETGEPIEGGGGGADAAVGEALEIAKRACGGDEQQRRGLGHGERILLSGRCP